jgi:hypothetical protein
MSKHTKKLYLGLSKELDLDPYSHVYGTEIILEEERLDEISHKVFLYLKNHKRAILDVGHGMFGNSNDELKRLAKLYVIKFGCKVEPIKENK